MLRKKIIKISIFSIAMMAIGLLVNRMPDTMAADNVNVTLKINTGIITYATGGTLNLGSGVASYLQQILSGAWTTDAFRVSDMRGTTAWTRSAGISNATSVGGGVISANGFQIKDVGVAQPHFMQGDNTCGMTTQLTTAYQVFTGGSQKQFLAKPGNSKICKYGVTPMIQVTIPAYQQVGDYTATVTLTSTW